MKTHTAHQNSALEWSVEYSTVPASTGQPYLVRARYEPERHGQSWTYKAVLFTEEGASKLLDKATSPSQQQAGGQADDQPARFTVERIVNMRRKQGRWSFKVKWLGHDMAACTWEDGANSMNFFYLKREIVCQKNTKTRNCVSK